MYTMILVVLLYNNSITTTTVTFNNEVNCLEAISKALEMEKTNRGLQVKARCVKN